MAPEGHDTDNADVAALEALHGAYRERFGEWPPMFSIGDDPIPAIEHALKTGQPIRENIPPGADA